MTEINSALQVSKRVRREHPAIDETEMRRIVPERWVGPLLESSLLGSVSLLGRFNLVPAHRILDEVLDLFPHCLQIGSNDGIDYMIDSESGFIWMIDHLDGRIAPLLVARSPEEFFGLFVRLLDAFDRRTEPDAWCWFAEGVPPELADGWAYHEIQFE